MPRSLRTRIQLWHAVILTLVIASFGTAFWYQLYHARLDEIDAELLSSARILEGTLRSVPPRRLESMISQLPLDLPRLHRPPPPAAFRSPDDALRPRPPGEFSSPPRPHPPPPGPPPTALYFSIFSAEGRLLRHDSEGLEVRWRMMRYPLEYRNIGERREVLLRGPAGTLIVVGRDIGRVLDRLRQVLLRLVAVAVSVLVLGLVGGWWLAGKAVEPIQRISQTATNVSATNLSERIDVAPLDAELQSLAVALNAMLGRIENSFEQQRQFTADASHELRTPLAVLLSHCELALARSRSPTEYIQTLTTCQRAGQRMQALVVGLLTLARADADKLELHLAAVDLKVIASESVELLNPLAEEHGIALSVGGTVTSGLVDAERISQVMVNVIHNAILYTPRGGTVLVETTEEEKQAVVRMRDSGVGIAAEAIPFLFDRFYRVEEARSRPSGGSGLGLAICKSIVEAHGGSLTVESQVGQGSTFTMRLPHAAT